MKRATPIRNPTELVDAALDQAQERPPLDKVAARYAVAISPEMMAAMNFADPSDPVARQFIPSAQELEVTPEEHSDPIGDDAHAPVEGIVHRYPDRVLLKLVHVCPVYCRYCFRREMVGPRGRGTLSATQVSRALHYIRDTPKIWEVILTGGEPLLLSPRRLRAVMRELANIAHVKI